ncbi:MAG: cytochrome c oxidase subunit II [Bryobacteraceae bacterium]|nr:cytochrome c oxidase subunit II [Bryobacteraceae bacterium]
MNSLLRNWMLPPGASEHARDIDTLYMFITWLCVFFFVLIVALTVSFAWKYRKSRSKGGPTPYLTHNTALELTWSVIPLFLLIGIFFWGFFGFVEAYVAPNDAIEIQVTGKKWLWAFEYPNGTRSVNSIHVPVGKPVKLVMSSEDVIHSFFIPDFRIKQDVIPNRYTEIWFHPEKPGVHQVFCTEYCGKSHSDMLAKVHVDDEATYNKWLEEGDEELKKMPLKELGKLIYEQRGCTQCHSIDGTRGQGPSFKGIWAQSHKFQDGSSLSVDANYIRQSILEPQAKIVAGYEPIMPSFQGLLREREILGVIEYIKSLQ